MLFLASILYHPRRFDGQIFLAFVFFYALWRVFLGPFRAETNQLALLGMTVPMNQIIALGITTCAGALYWHLWGGETNAKHVPVRKLE